MPLLYMFLQSVTTFVFVKEVTLGQTTFVTAVAKHLSYIVTYSFVSPMKAFDGISGRYKLSQMSLKQHNNIYYRLFVYDDAMKLNILTK